MSARGFPAVAVLLAAPSVAGQESGPATPRDQAQVEEARLERARAAFQEGQNAFEAEEFERAAAAFEIVFEITEWPDIAFNLAVCYERLGRTDETVEWYAKYLELRPDAPDRAQVEERIVVLSAAGAPEGEAVEGEEEAAPPLAAHRLRASVGWGFLPGGVRAAGADPIALDADGVALAAGYQLGLIGGLALDFEFGGAFVERIQGSGRTFDIWSLAAGLAYVWTSLPYVNLGARGDFCFYVFVPSVGDRHYLVPFRAGAWIEVPLASWVALHAGADAGIGAYAARDDKSFGFVVQAAAGAVFSLGGEEDDDGGGDAESGARASRSPPSTRAAPADDLGRSWQ